MQHTWMWLVAVLFFAFTLSVPAAQDALFNDEYRSVQHLGGVNGTHNFGEVLLSLSTRSPQHMPGYFLLLRAWSYLVGYSPLALRYLSILLGLLGIAWMYRLGTDLFSARVGLFAATLLGTSAFFIFYMHEMRMYSLLVALIIFECWIYYRVAIAKPEPPLVEWFALFIGTFFLASAATHALFPLVAFGLYHLLFVSNNRRKLLVIGVVLAAGLPLIPWLPVVLKGSETITTAPQWLFGFSFFRTLIVQMSNGTGILLFVLLGFAALQLRQSRSKAQRYLWIVALVSVLAMYIFNQWLPFVATYRSGRYYLTIYPGLLLLAALGLTWDKVSRYIQVALIAIWICAGIIYSQTHEFLNYNNREGDTAFSKFAPLSEIVTQFQRHQLGTSHDFVITLSTHPYTDYWESRQGAYFYGLLGIAGVVVDEQILQGMVSENRYEELGIREHYRTIWLAYAPQVIPPNLIQQATSILAADYTACPPVVATNELHLQSYVRQPFECDMPLPDAALAIYDEQDITLKAVQLVATDAALHVAVAWNVQPTVPLNQYSASLQIFDTHGTLVFQHDYGLEHSISGYWYLTMGDISAWVADTYTINAIVYNWATGERLTAINPDGGSQNTILPVAEFTISK